MDLTGLIEKRNRKGTLYYEDEEGVIVAKMCTKCQKVKYISEFQSHVRKFAGKQSHCKDCDKIYVAKNKSRKKAYRYLNRENERRRKNEWIKNNKDRARAQIIRRKARKKGLPDDFTLNQQEQTLFRFNFTCALTGETLNRSWDHAIPLATGCGGTTHGNMYPLRHDLNCSKQDVNIFEWFEANRQRFELSQARFDSLIAWLAETNDMTVEEYTAYVYECHGEKYEEAM